MSSEKMPVVGKRYRKLDLHNVWICKDLYIERTPNGKRLAIMEFGDIFTDIFQLKIDLKEKDFWEIFEELPEDKAEIKPETQNHVSELSSEVKEAMEELRKKYNSLVSKQDISSIFNPINEDLLQKI